MTRLLLSLAVVPAGLLLSGCCCCNLSSWIPDSIEENVMEEVAERGVEAATGTRIDAEEGRLEIEGEGGKMVIGEGHAGVDPRIPIVGHPGCPVAGGLAAEADGEFNGTMVQSECKVSFDDLEKHYLKQFEALGAEPKNVIETSTDGRRGKVMQAEGGERFKTLSVVIGEEDDGTTSAMVNVVVKLD